MNRDINTLSIPFLDALYEQYLSDPQSVDPQWQDYFATLAQGNGKPPAAARSAATRPPASPAPAPPAQTQPPASMPTKPTTSDRPEARMALLQDRLDQLVRAFRARGHMVARVDPLGRPSAPEPDLDPANYGFLESDLDLPFSTETLGGDNQQTLRQIIASLRRTYCRCIGVQFMHISDPEVRRWIQYRVERTQNTLKLGRSEQLRILTRLTDAVIFEEFIQKKYIGAKSFSLEGAESLIPLLDLAIEKAATQHIDKIVLGMAHRGRLNVLANVMGKSPQQIFREFEDQNPDPHYSPGDVKYHLGYSAERRTASGRNVHLSLCFNPSHLEYINTVAMGRMRCKQDRNDDTDRERGMVLLIHGDASFAGEGVVQEGLNMSELPGYTVGGTLHVIVNNQIGFTTAPQQGRSTFYATDVARMLQIPIFHVNGENPEAVAQVVSLALDFRKQFKRDVVIDMYCYRRRGHNEGDEPTFTQPLMYETIDRRPSVRDGYLKQLATMGEVTQEEAEQIAEQRQQHLMQDLEIARSELFVTRPNSLAGVWTGYIGGPESEAGDVPTAVVSEQLSQLLVQLTKTPEDFVVHRKLQRLMNNRIEMAEGKRPLDWSAAEALAMATLAIEGYRVRMSGQDSERGTFSHRHAVLHDNNTGKAYHSLQNISEDQAPVEIINSPLSESGVMGFEYGYSLDCPDGLILWEAQFGDFYNAAQVIIDQFLASAEKKWNRLSGLVLLLPHGFEGQGPEHSSARLERFLMLAAEDNFQIVNATTPAQYFHLLRRQVLRRWRKPLVVMSPKSLLRNPRVVSPLADFAEGRFQKVIPDTLAPEKVSAILLCSGKVYYDLLAQRESLNRENVAIVRIEQLYPLPRKELTQALAPYRENTPAYWVQEEPQNMGAWRYIRWNFGAKLLDRFPLSGIYRPASSSPATGSASRHKLEQEQLVAQAFAVAQPAQ